MSWTARQRNFLDFTLSSLLRRKGKNASVVLVYALMVFLLASVMFFAQSLRNEARELLSRSPEMVVQRMVAGRHDLIPASYLEFVSAIRGVGAVEGRLWGYYFHQASMANYTVLVDKGLQGGPETAMVGPGVASTWRDDRPLVSGDEIMFRGFDGSPVAFTVAGLLDPRTELVSTDLIVLSEDGWRRLFGTPPGLYTDLAVKMRNEREAPTVAEKIVRGLPGTRPITRAESLRTYAAIFDWRGGYAVVLMLSACAAFLIFAWDKATGLSAEERAEIGVLKALGWDTADVLLLKVWEGAAVSLTAFALGVGAAYVHVFLGRAGLFEHALKGWAVLYPRFTPAPSVDLLQLSALFLLTVAPYALITILPAWGAAVTDPDTVMRHS